jgi:thiosulfate/3-mercaptopyruvate sulfurtransferase
VISTRVPGAPPLSPEKVKRLLADKGIKADRPVVFYCTGGVRSAYAWMVHQLTGLAGGINYGGGMEAWLRRPGGDINR